MIQNRVTLVPGSQISWAPTTGLERLRALRRSLRSVRQTQVLIGAAAIAGQLALAYAALSPSVTVEPDGGSTMRLLLPYSAMMLGFLSSYWGLWKPVEVVDDAPYSPRRAALAERARLIASLVPTILGGIAMLLPMVLPPVAGLFTLLAGFVLLLGMEWAGERRTMPAASFLALRWIITLGAIAILLNVATVHLYGFSLFF